MEKTFEEIVAEFKVMLDKVDIKGMLEYAKKYQGEISFELNSTSIENEDGSRAYHYTFVKACNMQTGEVIN